MKTVVIVLSALVSASALAETSVISDEALKNLNLPDVRIESISHEAVSEDGGVTFYDVDGIIGGTIRFELLLPDNWNGRFAMGGGGGFVGSVQNGARGSVSRGYATVGTDTGHQGVDGSFGLDDELARVNFGHIAIHRTAEVAKAIIRAHYDSDPEYSYFLGCSRGGGQAMMASQRYPEDFDGIVAGAPAFDWAGFSATGVNIVQALYPNPEMLTKTLITKKDIRRLLNDVLEQCDEQDGLKDGIISDPLNVEFDLKKVKWLTRKQRAAVQVIYDGVKNHDGDIYPGFPLGSEIEWFDWLVGPVSNLGGVPSLSFHFCVGLYRYFVFNDADWDYSDYDFSTWATDTRLMASTLSAIDTDLSAFSDRGGKLILWHGWSDAALPAERTQMYYEDLLEKDTDAKDYSRLYLIPGCGHCGGGPGISSVDWLDTITRWVEQGEAPEEIVASKGGQAPATRPLSPFPKMTVYKGSGDPNEARNFESSER